MYAPALMGIILRIVKSKVSAEDILQEVFVKIWRSIDQYDVSRGRLFTWMSTTARNSALEFVRSKTSFQREKNTDIEEVFNLVEKLNPTILNPDIIGLKRLTDGLPEQERIVLDLIYFHGHTHMQTSEILRLPLGTVKTRLRRAIQFLRGQFNT
jgi:RNA polymerase sigma factor (sigma-70 family)